MLLVSWIARWQLYQLQDIKPWMAKVLVGMTFSGWVAVVAGWYVTEIGRQPFLVYGLLKTVDAITFVKSSHVALSLVLYLMIYALLLAAYITTIFYMAVKNKDKLLEKEEIDPRTGQRRTIIIGA